MSDAIASASGRSTVLGISSSGYQFDWVRLSFPAASGYQFSWTQITYPNEAGYLVGWVHISYPHEAGYQVAWAQIQLPYIITSITLVGGHGVSRGALAKHPIVDDRNDLQDLCEIWELMNRKAA